MVWVTLGWEHLEAPAFRLLVRGLAEGEVLTGGEGLEVLAACAGQETLAGDDVTPALRPWSLPLPASAPPRNLTLSCSAIYRVALTPKPQ